MNIFERLAQAMRDQIEHPDQNPEDTLKKAGLNPEPSGETAKKKVKPAKKPTNWMQEWEQKHE